MRQGPRIVTQLALDLADLGRARTRRGHTPVHGERRTRDAERQLARCEILLAAQRLAERPRWRRCELCDGIEDTTQPHAHRAA